MNRSSAAFETETSMRDLLFEDMSFVLDTYLSDTPLQLAAMCKAVAQRDFSLLGRAARSLRSSSERVGADQVARLARKLGAVVGYRGSVDDAAILVADLAASFEKIAPGLRRLLPQG